MCEWRRRLVGTGCGLTGMADTDIAGVGLERVVVVVEHRQDAVVFICLRQNRIAPLRAERQSFDSERSVASDGF